MVWKRKVGKISRRANSFFPANHNHNASALCVSSISYWDSHSNMLIRFLSPPFFCFFLFSVLCFLNCYYCFCCFVVIVLSQDKVSFYSPGCPQTGSVDQISLEHTEHCLLLPTWCWNWRDVPSNLAAQLLVRLQSAF